MKNSKMNTVLIAIDYNPTSQKIAEVGYALAKAMKAEVSLLHVISNQTTYAPTVFDPIMGYAGFVDIDVLHPEYNENQKNAAQEFLEKAKEHLGDTKIETIVEEGDFSEVILKTATKINADIIVIGSHSKKWLETILLGSTTSQVLNHSNIPLLIVPTKKK
jgi:nucleotide-binding universal stress UspA family protein